MKSEAVLQSVLKVKKAENRVPRYVLPLVKAAIFAADAVLTILCFFIAFKIREKNAILSPTAFAWSKDFVPYAGILYFAVPCRLAMLVYQRIFRLQGAFAYTQEAIKIFKAVSVSALLTVAWAFLFRGGFAFREFSYSRGVFFLDFAVSLIVFSFFHFAVRSAQAIVRRRDINLIPTLIVGTNSEAAQTLRELKERKDLGYRVIGIVETQKTGNAKIEKQKSEIENQVIGSLDDLPDLIRELDIQEVIITDSEVASEKLFEIMMQIGRRRRVEFRFAPNLFNLLPQKTSVEQIGVLPMVRLFREPLSDAQRLVKRVFDLLISLGSLLVLSPVLLVISLFIKFDSRGAIFFKQERIGMDGRVFLCYKFRTMKANADERIHRDAYLKNIEGGAEANAGNAEKPVFGKVKNDPRVTEAGKFLRRSSLDELPQLFNVLKGDMSVIGPRPPIQYEVENYDLRHRKRLDMKPGMTGLWQVSGRNRLTFEEMVKIDLFYIENWSLWLDLKIILLTLPAVLRGDGAK